MITHTKESQKLIGPKKAIQYLKEGNQRFVNNLRLNRNLLEQVNETSNGQFPFAVILSCIDSRTSAELIFDQGLGDIFSIRIAGNIVNRDIIGSMEYSCKVAGSKLIVVLGHTKCGAVTSACKSIELGNLTPLLRKINAATTKVKIPSSGMITDNLVRRAAEENVKAAIAEIRSDSPILAEMESLEEIKIVGAMYDVRTGEVKFMPD